MQFNDIAKELSIATSTTHRIYKRFESTGTVDPINVRNHIRKYGCSLRGITPVYHRVITHGRRVSAIAAISASGLVGVELTYGTVNGDTS